MNESSPFFLLLVLIGAVWLLFSLWFLWARKKDDYSVIDICWSLGFLAQGLAVSFVLKERGLPLSSGHYVILGLVSLWAIRLAGYIAYRNRKKGEDSRYTAWRKDWEPHVGRNFYFRVYLLQALLNLLVGVGLVAVLSLSDIPKGQQFRVGILMALFGFFYEAIADYQKDQFKKKEENRGKPCRVGLWYYSRHPNYFGEMVFWWGIFLFSIGTSAFWYAWIGPVLITFFLANVSGVPLLTEQYKKKPLYKEYLETTNTFFPWPPKRSS